MSKPQQLRVNIVVTEEQRRLLAELVRLDPSTRSPAGFVRQLLDQVTPLLRVMVPAMTAAAEELSTSRESLRLPMADFLGALQQLDLLDPPASAGAPARSVSEDGRTTARSGRSK